MAAPSAPAILARNWTNTVVKVTWRPVTGATSYKLYRATTPNPTVLIVTISPIDGVLASEALDATVTPGLFYHYRVKAHNTDGDSSYSNDVYVVSQNYDETDPAPTGALLANRSTLAS